MAIKSRPAKGHGGTEYRAGDVIKSAELNSDFDTIYTEFNGLIDDANIKPGAGTTRVDPTKLDDYSATDAESNTVVLPGDTASPVKATDLAGELARLRHNDLSSAHGISAEYRTAAGTYASIGPWEEPPQGGNLISNGSLQTYNTGSGVPPTDAPDGWSLVGTPDTCQITTTPTSEGDWNTVQIISGSAAAEGITQDITGLKPDTKYIVGARVRAVTGTGAVLDVAGAIAAGDYRAGAAALAPASGAFETVALVVKTDATPTDLTVSIQISGTSAVEFHVHSVWMYELATDRIDPGTFASTSKRIAAEVTYAGDSSGSWREITQLTAAVIPPTGGLAIDTHASITGWISKAAVDMQLFVRLTENGTVVAGPVLVNTTDAFASLFVNSSASLHAVNSLVQAGTTYTYKVEFWNIAGADATYTYAFAPLDALHTANVQLACDVVASLRRAV